MKCPTTDIPLEPYYNYIVPPCLVQDGDARSDCTPFNDTWATAEGFAKLEEQDAWSVPVSSANSMFPQEREGISVDDAIGIGDCGCKTASKDGSRQICSIIGAAIRNAEKSNGLHWTSFMMHPQTVFNSTNQSYIEWLDDFYAKITALEDWEVRFINFQDVPALKAPNGKSGSRSGEALVV